MLPPAGAVNSTRGRVAQCGVARRSDPGNRTINTDPSSRADAFQPGRSGCWSRSLGSETTGQKGLRAVGIEYECDRCRCVQDVRDDPYVGYVLPDGRVFFRSPEIGWCFRCRLLSEIEVIPELDFLQAWLVELRRDTNNATNKMLLEHVTALLDWSRMRTKPPQCLRCGSLKFTALRQDGECLVEGRETSFFYHPKCGGVFRIKAVSFDELVDLPLTAEGDPIGWRWDGAFVRWINRFICWLSGKRSRRDFPPYPPM